MVAANTIPVPWVYQVRFPQTQSTTIDSRVENPAFTDGDTGLPRKKVLGVQAIALLELSSRAVECDFFTG